MIITKYQQYILFDCREPNLILDNLPLQIKSKIEKIQTVNTEVGTSVFWPNGQLTTLEKNTPYLLYSKPGQIGYDLPGVISPKDWCSSKTIPLNNNLDCSNICNSKCCEDPDWVCCDDGIHCAETINDCPQLSNITSSSVEISGKTINLADYFNTSFKPITLCYSNTNNKLIIPEYKGYNLAVYFDAYGNQISQQQVIPGQILGFQSTIVLGGSNAVGDILPSPPTIISVESGSGAPEYPASTIVKIEPEKNYDLTQNADTYVFRFNGVAVQPSRIGPAPAIQDCCPELEINAYEFSGDYTGQFVTVASVNSYGTGIYSFPKLMGLGTCFISDGTIFASGDESGCGEYATDKGLEYEWTPTEAPRNGSWCNGFIACDGRFYVTGCTSGSFEDWLEGNKSESVQGFQEGKLCDEISCIIDKAPPECGVPGCVCEGDCELCNNGKCISYCDSSGQTCCNDGVTCCGGEGTDRYSVCCASGCCSAGECCNLDEFGQEFCGACLCTGGKICPPDQTCCMGICIRANEVCCMDVFGPIEGACIPSNCEACMTNEYGAPVCQPLCDKEKCCKDPFAATYSCADSRCCTPSGIGGGGDSDCNPCEICINGACIYQCDNTACERCIPGGALNGICAPFVANNECESCSNGVPIRCGQDPDGTLNCERCLEFDGIFECTTTGCGENQQCCTDGEWANGCQQCCSNADCGGSNCSECKEYKQGTDNRYRICESKCEGCQKCQNNECVSDCGEGQCCIRRKGQIIGEYTCEDCTPCDLNNGNDDCSYFLDELYVVGYCCSGACQPIPCCEGNDFYSKCLGQCINVLDRCTMENPDMVNSYWDEDCCCCKCVPENVGNCIGKQIIDPTTCACKCPPSVEEICESAGLIFDSVTCGCCTSLDDEQTCLCNEEQSTLCPQIMGTDGVPIEIYDPILCQCVCDKNLCTQSVCFGKNRPCKLPQSGWNLISRESGEYCYERRHLVDNDELCQPVLLCGTCPEGWEETPAWGPDDMIIPGIVGGCCPPHSPFDLESRTCSGVTPSGVIGGSWTQAKTRCPCHESLC